MLSTPKIVAALLMTNREIITAMEQPCFRSADVQQDFHQKIPELLQLEQLIGEHSHLLHACCETTVQHGAMEFPLYSLRLGSSAPSAPTLLLTGGIHGIERIGSQVLIAWLQSLLERLRWDTGVQQQLQQLQLVIMPIIHPHRIHYRHDH